MLLWEDERAYLNNRFHITKSLPLRLFHINNQSHNNNNYISNRLTNSNNHNNISIMAFHMGISSQEDHEDIMTLILYHTVKYFHT